MSRSGLVLGIAALSAVFLVVVLAMGFGKDPHSVPFGLKGKPAPAFTATDLRTGETVTLDGVRGQPLVLNFWASWCEPCKLEHPTVEWGARTFGHRARFLGVLFEDSAENARRYLDLRGTGIPHLIDPSSRIAVDYGTTGVPETYFIDANGIIQEKHIGPIDPQTLKRHLDRIAPERGALR
jgi:cytochrome c biogenesis protein CcmG/thiol:disulfide interchange protein DsbE